MENSTLRLFSKVSDIDFTKLCIAWETLQNVKSEKQLISIFSNYSKDEILAICLYFTVYNGLTKEEKKKSMKSLSPLLDLIEKKEMIDNI